MLTLTLAFLLPRRVAADRIFSRARWLMTSGMAMLTIQFFLQFTLGFRKMGVTQAVMINLVFFIPSIVLMSAGILCLQRRGRITLRDWIPGLVVWALIIGLFASVVLISGQPLLADTPQMRRVEYISSIAYCFLQFHYTFIHLRENRRISRALNNYYDHEMGDLIQWLNRSIKMLTLLALLAPFIIFSSGIPLMVYAILLFFSIYYMVFCFICYGVGNDFRRVEEAERNEEEAAMDASHAHELSPSDFQRVDRAVKHWVQKGGHLHSGITMQTAISEMKLPRYLLISWLKTTEYDVFNNWLAHLRIEEAKRLMVEHPEWSNDTIGQQCGFNTRNYFQTVFRKQVGVTPAQYMESLEHDASIES